MSMSRFNVVCFTSFDGSNKDLYQALPRFGSSMIQAQVLLARTFEPLRRRFLEISTPICRQAVASQHVEYQVASTCINIGPKEVTLKSKFPHSKETNNNYNFSSFNKIIWFVPPNHILSYPFIFQDICQERIFQPRGTAEIQCLSHLEKIIRQGPGEG